MKILKNDFDLKLPSFKKKTQIIILIIRIKSNIWKKFFVKFIPLTKGIVCKFEILSPSRSSKSLLKFSDCFSKTLSGLLVTSSMNWGKSFLFIFKASDILNNFEEFGVCTHYKYDDIETKNLPFDMVNKTIATTTKTFKSWGNIDASKPLPTELKDYVAFLEEYLTVPVAMVSNGPGREELIDLENGKLLA